MEIFCKDCLRIKSDFKVNSSVFIKINPAVMVTVPSICIPPQYLFALENMASKNN